MGRKWTKAQREAASRRATAYWAKVRADNEAKQRAAQARSSRHPSCPGGGVSCWLSDSVKGLDSFVGLDKIGAAAA